MPTAVFNGFQLLNDACQKVLNQPELSGPDRLKAFFKKYFLDRKTSDPSRPEKSRYDQEVGGVLDEDAVIAINEFLSENCSSKRVTAYKTSDANNPFSEVVTTLKRGMENGVPVLLSLQVQAVGFADGRPLWQGQGGHVVTLVSISDYEANLNGVELKIHDPYDNRFKKAFLSYNSHHAFIGLNWNYGVSEWTKNKYLTLDIPDFAGWSNIPWYSRLVIYPTVAIGDFSPK